MNLYKALKIPSSDRIMINTIDILITNIDWMHQVLDLMQCALYGLYYVILIIIQGGCIIFISLIL